MLTVEEIRCGRRVPFGPNGEPSAIAKEPATGTVTLRSEGLVGDEQGDRRHHGGVDKAVHHYPADHYAYWRTCGVRIDGREPGPGAFGENLVTYGLTESAVCIGDVFRLGSATVEVCQPRQPCWRLNVRFGDAQMARRVQDSRRTGWYYRVQEPGEIAPGGRLELIDRPYPEWTLGTVLDLFYDRPLERDSLQALLEIAPLAEAWRALIRRRLERGLVEDWEPRLNTPATQAR